MEFSEIWNIVLLVIAVLSATSWGVLFKRGRNVWKNLQKLSEQYSEATEDDNITDEERLLIADTVVELVIDVTTIGQIIHNMIRKIMRIKE